MKYNKLLKLMTKEYTKPMTEERKAQLDSWVNVRCDVIENGRVCKNYAAELSESITTFLKEHEGTLVFKTPCTPHQEQFIEVITNKYGKPKSDK